MPTTNRKTLTFGKFVITFSLLFVSCVFFANSQSLNVEYACKHYTVQEGLAQMQVMSLFRDHKGYLWCVTKAGISRFDGHRFKNYTNGILPGFDITVMGEGNDGRIILFGPTYFAELKEDTVIHHQFPDEANSSSIFPHSEKHKQKALYVPAFKQNSTNAILDYSDLDSLKIYAVNKDFGNIVFLESGANNYVWQSNFDTLFISDVKSGRLINKIHNPNKIKSLVQYGNGFVGVDKQSTIYQLKENVFVPILQINEAVRYLKIIATPANDALIIKTDKNLYFYKNKLVLIKKDLTQIRDLLFDQEDNLWVATEEGLYNFFQLNFVNYSFNMGNKDWVWSVLEDHDKNFWFASYQNGLWKWDGTTTTDYTGKLNAQLNQHLTTRPIPEYYRYYMGASKSDKALYFPTECNVLKLENNTFGPVEGLPELPYQMTKTYTDGTLYCSGYPGLFEMGKNKAIKSWHRNDLKVSSVRNFERCGPDSLIVIGQDGISLIAGDSIVHFGNETSRYSYSLAKDHQNNIWIGGIQNVNLYSNSSVKHVKKLSEEAIYSMLFVQPHYLFMGGIKGLYIADLNEYYQTGNFETVLYNQSNGFTGAECGQNGFFTDSEGMVWIPTSDLVTRFDPQKLIENKIKAPRIFLNTSISSDNIRWHSLAATRPLDLRYFQKNIRFTVDAVSFTNSGNLRYFYQLEGLQNQWSEASEINEVTYYNLKPGTYQFRVKADAGISKATTEILSLSFTIGVPFWMKWWFIGIEILALAALIVALVQYFRKREKQKAAIQQRLTQLRGEALAAQLDPHFVMNCLNNISGLVNAGYKQQANEYIVKFSKLLRVILQSVKKEAISLSSEIEIVSHYLELERFRCNNCFSYRIAVPKNYSTNTIMVPPMMLQPLVENSIKHGFGAQKINNAHIEIRITAKDKTLYISIADNGRGLKKQSPELGTGLGTKITRERIELLQKTRDISFKISEINPGTEVTFHIPLVVYTDKSRE